MESKGRFVARISFALTVFFLLSFSPDAECALKWLKNDGFVEGGLAFYQAGFVANEIMAARFVAEPEDYPYELTKVRVLVGDGGSGGTIGPFILHLWEDTGAMQPGPTLKAPEGVQLTAGPYWNDFDIIPPITIESGMIRVGFEFFQDPPPSFYRDADGNINPGVNFIYVPGVGWFFSEQFGLQGDWVLRVQIDTPATPTPEPTNTPTQTPTPVPTNTPSPSPTPESPLVPAMNIWGMIIAVSAFMLLLFFRRPATVFCRLNRRNSRKA